MKLNINKIKILMSIKKMNQSGLAKALGLKPNAISQMFKSKRTSTITIGKLAEVLGVPVEEIILTEEE